MPSPHISLLEILKSSGSPRIKILKLVDFIVGSLLAGILKEKGAASITSLKIESVLVIRPGGIGDAIFLLPILKRLRQEHPAIKIDILCEQRNKEVFTSQEGLCQTIYCYDELEFLFSIFKNKYDVVVDTEQWHYLSAITAYFLKFKVTVGFATRPLRAKLFNQRIGYQLNAYELDNFKALFEPLIGPCQDIQDINLCYTLTDTLLPWAKEKVPPKSVALFLGGSIAPRRLTQKQSSEIVRYIFEKNYSVILLGGRDVQEIAEAIEEEIRDPRLLNFVGQMSLKQSAALVRETKLFIGPDSGLMHLACAVGTPVVGIFGPGNLAKWHPKGVQHNVVTENVECSPCTRFGYTVPTCRGSYKCMRGLEMEKIYLILEEKLKI